MRVAQLHVRSDDSGILAELGLPELVAEDRRERNAEPVVVGREPSSDHRLHAEQPERVRRDHAAVDEDRFPVSAERLRAARGGGYGIDGTKWSRAQHLRERLVRDVAATSARWRAFGAGAGR